MSRLHRAASYGVVLAALLLADPAAAQTTGDSPESFYNNRQITILIASGVGGGYDTYARAFARHASRHIPGHPGFVPKNLPAAGGIVAANTLYNAAERDGSVIAALTNGVPMDPLLGTSGVQFDALKLTWIGSIGKLQNVCATWHASPIKTIDDARKREVIVGAAGPTSNSAIVPKIVNALLGTQFKVITGYDPGAGIRLALEKGETEGICGLSWSTLKASNPDWVRDHKLNVFLQLAFDKHPELPDVPSAIDLITDDTDRRTLELILIRQETGRPIAAPPDVPADRLAALRKAFDATMADPRFLAEAEKLQMEVDPLSHDQVEALLKKAYSAPKPIVERAAALILPPKKG